MSDRKKQQLILHTLWFIALVFWVVFVFRFVVPATLPFWLGLLVAVFLRPVTLLLSKRLHFRRRSATFTILLIFYLLVGALLWGTGALILSRLQELALRLPQLYTKNVQPLLHDGMLRITGLLTELPPPTASAIAEKIQVAATGFGNGLASFSGELAAKATTLAGKIPFALLTVGFSVICSVLISMDYPRIMALLLKILPPKQGQLLLECKKFVVVTLGRLARAYCILLFVTFIQLVIGFVLLGVPSAVGLAAVFALLDLLPFIGTGLLLVPWGVFELLQSNVPMGVGLLLLYGVIAVVRSMLEPKIVGASIGLPPLVTIVAMYAGMKWMGAAGLVAAPLVALLAQHLFFHKKGTVTTETSTV